jgi:hypothetical protein
LGKIDPLLGCAHLVPGATDALQPEADRTRRLDLDHQVDRAHVDAELERARGHQARSSPRFSSSSMTSRCSRDSEPWWALTSSIAGAGPRCLGGS